MASELTRYLFALTAASSVGIITALMLRRAVRPISGAVVSYSIWAIVPVGMASVFMPRGIDPGSNSILALSQVMAVSAVPADELGSPFFRPELVLGAWAIGAAFCVLYFAGQQCMFIRKLGGLSGSQRVVRAKRSSGGPAVLGFFRPRVILPADFNLRYSPLERLLIFSHERAHLRRGDSALNAFVALLRCVFWFNPLIHLASAYFRIDQEIACDARVLEIHPESRRAYARAMLKTELANEALPVGCHWRSIRHLKERLHMVEKPLPGHARRRCGNVFVALTALLIGYSVWAAQPQAGAPSGPGDVSSSVSGDAGAGIRASFVHSRAAAVRPGVVSWPSHLERFYPAEAKAHGAEGMVRIAVTLDEEGRATDTRIISVTPQGMGFAAAASTMVHFMTFSNPTGHPATVKLPVKFALQRATRTHHHRSLENRHT